MKSTKRIISIILCIIILSLSPMASYLDATSILVVHAADPITLTYEIMQAICAAIGSMVFSYTPVVRPDLPTDEEVIRFGYDFICELNSAIFPPSYDYEYDAANDTVVFYDRSGQSYVFGSEAFDEISVTEFQLILGGGDPGDDDDDDDDESKKTGNHLLEVWRAGELFVAVGSIVGSHITDKVQEMWDKFINGEPSIYDSVFADLAEQAFTGYDAIQNEDLTYNVSGICNFDHQGHSWAYVLSDTCANGKPFAIMGSSGITFYSYLNGKASFHSFNCTIYRDGAYYNSYKVGAFNQLGWEGVKNVSYSVGFPIFPSNEAALAALKANDFTSALNYAKVYREADWLAENWAGRLIDPLTGLNALSNYYNIARHQGLNALGNELGPDDFVDYLRDYFAHLGTDTLPEVDPSLAPIIFPSTLPDFTLDPARNPVIQPAVVPKPDPKPDPDPDPDPGPGINPKPDPNPDPDKDPAEEIDLDEELPGMPGTFLPLAEQMQHKFPFSIPWDIKYLFDQLSAKGREPPRWVLPVVVESIGLHEELVIDLKGFQAVSDLSRLFLTLLFCLCLINMTVKIVGMRKEE